MSVNKIFLHVERSKELGSNEIYVFERIKPDVLQSPNFGVETLCLNLLHVREVWLYGYIIQDSS
jgi:hypothetical protein